MNQKFFRYLGFLFIATVILTVTVSAKDKVWNSPSITQDIDTAGVSPVLIASLESATSAEEIALKAATKFNSNNTKTTAVVSKEVILSKLHPLSVAFVQAYQKKNEDKLLEFESKFSKQFTLIDNILTTHGLPLELKYLALIESEFDGKAVSNKGAVGPWQFMAPTGRLMGLTVNKYKDERKDFSKSTHAAAKYLKTLYSQFNDWLLVIAAYNGGASRVEYAIKKANSRDFWRLQSYLPAESRMHVKKYVATKFVYETNAALAFAPLMDVSKLTELELTNSTTVTISGKYKAAVIAKMLEMDPADFNNYNPNFDAEVIVNGYELRLPKEKMDIFSAHRRDILGASIQNMLNENNSIIGTSDSKNDYPEAIQLTKPKAVTPTEQSKKKK